MTNMEQFRSILILFSTIILSLNFISCEKQLLTNQAALFVFGNSVFDVGNNNYINTFGSAQANVWPYGQTTFKFPTGRNSDGRLIPDFIAEYAWLPLIPAYLQPGNNINHFTYDVNFATAGAVALLETYQLRLIQHKYSLFDAYLSGTQAMENPTKYGFKEVKKACCGSGPFRGSSTCGYRSGTSRDFELCENVRDYMFCDGSHASEKANQQTAELMWDGPSDLVGSVNLTTLFRKF